MSLRLVDLMSVEETDDARCLARLFLVVGHHDNGAAVFPVERMEDVHHLGAHR